MVARVDQDLTQVIKQPTSSRAIVDQDVAKVIKQPTSSRALVDNQLQKVIKKATSSKARVDNQVILVVLQNVTLQQIIGGRFKDCLGNPLSNGFLVMTLTSDENYVSTNQVVAGLSVRVRLDNNGSVAGRVLVYANDSVTPTGSKYIVQVFSSDGRPAWSTSHKFSIPSTPHPYDISNWVPN